MLCVPYVCCIFIIVMFSIPYKFVCSVNALPVNGVNSAVFNLLILFCLPYQIQYKRANLVFTVNVFVVIPHNLTYPRWSPHYLPERPRHSPAPLYCASPRSLHLALSHLRALSRGLTRRGHKGTEVESRNSSIVSLTLTLDWGGGSMPCPGHFTPGNALTTTVEEAGSGQCTKPCPHWQSLHEQ